MFIVEYIAKLAFVICLVGVVLLWCRLILAWYVLLALFFMNKYYIHHSKIVIDCYWLAIRPNKSIGPSYNIIKITTLSVYWSASLYSIYSQFCVVLDWPPESLIVLDQSEEPRSGFTNYGPLGFSTRFVIAHPNLMMWYSTRIPHQIYHLLLTQYYYSHHRHHPVVRNWLPSHHVSD